MGKMFGVWWDSESKRHLT